ncbi:MAG: hypothetical protein RLO17_14650 [Cyclobacteriaceae bacterium]
MKNTFLAIVGICLIVIGLAAWALGYFSAKSENKKKMEKVREAKEEKAKLRKMEVQEETESLNNGSTEDESNAKQTGT